MLFTKMAKLLGIKHTWKWQCEQTWRNEVASKQLKYGANAGNSILPLQFYARIVQKTIKIIKGNITMMRVGKVLI